MSELTHYSLQVIRLEGVGREPRSPGLYYKAKIGDQDLRTGIIPGGNTSSDVDILTFSTSDTSDVIIIRVKESSRNVIGYTSEIMANLLDKCLDGEGCLQLSRARAPAANIYLQLKEIDYVTRVGIDVKCVTRCIDRVMGSARFANTNEALGSFFEMAGKVVEAAGDLIGSIHPVLNVAWKAATALHKLVSKQIKNDKSFVDLIEAMASAFGFARDADALPNKTKVLTSVVEELLTGTIECCLFAQEYVKHGFVGRILHLENGWKIEDHTKRFVELRGKLDTGIGLHIAVGVENVAHKIDQIDAREQLGWLRERLEPSKSDTGTRPRCMNNTCKKYLDLIMKWFGSSAKQNILWLNGIAGSGKSTIAATIRDRCDQSSRLAAYLFFERGKDEFRSIIRSIAYQLAEYNETLRFHIAEAVVRHKHVVGSSPMAQFETLLLEPLCAAAQTVEGPVTIILDALDECGTSEQRREILKLLGTDFADLPIEFRFLVTSRPENDIMISLRHRRHIHEIDLDHTSEDSRQDVNTFIGEELREIVTDIPDAEAWDNMMKFLFDTANGLFIWASTMIKAVRASDDPLQKLQDLTRDIRLPSKYGLDGLYATILLQSGISWDDTTSKDRFTRVISIILFGKESLTVETIDGILGLEEGKARLTLQRLRSIVSYEAGRSIRIHHSSFGDYLTSPERSGDKPWFIGAEREKQVISVRCFNIMAELLRFNICDIESSFISNDCVPHLERRIHKNISPGLSYACRFWAEHLCDAPHSLDCRDSLDKLRDFAFNHLLHWLEVLSLTGNFNRTAGRSLYNVFMLTTKNTNDLSSFLWDAYKLVSSFSLPISKSAPHIYLSALSLRKGESLTSDHFSKKYPTVHMHVMGIKPPDPCIKILKGNSGGITCFAVSADGKYIASGGRRGAILIWDAESGELVLDPLVLGQNEHPIMCVEFLPGEKRLAAIDEVGVIRVLSTESGKLDISPFSCHSGKVGAAAFSSDGKRIAIGFANGSIRVLSVRNGKVLLGPLPGHTRCVTGIVFSRNGNFMASSSYDCSVKIWDAESGTLSYTSQLEQDCLLSIDLSPNENRVAYVRADNTIRVLDLKGSKTVLDTLKGHDGMVNSVAFSPDGKLIASSSHDRTIRVWGAKSGEPVSSPLLGHMAEVRTVAFFSDGKRIGSGSDDGTVRIWDVQGNNADSGILKGHESSVESVAFSPDSMRVVTGANDGTICVWDVGTGRTLVGPLKTHNERINCVTFSPDGNFIASASKDNTVRFWDVISGRACWDPLEHSYSFNGVLSVSFSSDGKRIATSCSNGKITVSEAGGDTLWSWQLQPRTFYSITFSPDGSRIVSSASDRCVRVHDAKSGDLLLGPLKGHTDTVTSVAFSCDGKRFASGSDDRTIRIWDADSGQLVSGPFNIHKRRVTSVSFLPYGNYVISCSEDCSIQVYNVESGRTVLGPFLGHQECVTFVAVSPCGRYVASTSRDRTIRIWNIEIDSPVVLNKRDSSHMRSILADTSAIATHIDTSTRTLGVQKVLTQTSRPKECEMSSLEVHQDGWLRGARGELIIWIPEDMRQTICGWRNSSILNCQFSTALDFASSPLGVNWCKGYPSSQFDGENFPAEMEEDSPARPEHEHTPPLHPLASPASETPSLKRRKL